MPLLIDRAAFANLVDHAASVAMQVTDPRGLKVVADLPRRREADGFMGHDMERIASIMLGALVAMVNHPVLVADEIPISLPDIMKD